jgi:hypothetical protein
MNVTKPIGRFQPVHQLICASVVVAVAALTWQSSASSLPGWMPRLWIDTSAIPRNAIVLVGPLVAGVGAWIGGSRHTLAIGSVPSRGWHRIAVAQLIPLTTSVIVGSTLGLSPALIETQQNATSGSLDIVVLLSGWLATVALMVAGYALGVAWRSKIAVVVAAIAVLPLVMAPILLSDVLAGSTEQGTQGTSLYSVAPVWLDFAAQAGQREIVLAGLQRVLFFAAVCGAGLLFAIQIGRPERQGRLRIALVPLLVPMALGSVMIVNQPALVEASSQFTCEDVTGTSVCVPSDISIQLAPFAAGASQVIDTWGYGALTQKIGTGFALSDEVYVSNQPTESLTRDYAILTTAMAVAGQGACQTLAADDNDLSTGGRYADAYAFTIDLARTVALRSGAPADLVDASLYAADPEGTDQLMALTDGEFSDFLDRHAEQLAACTQSEL